MSQNNYDLVSIKIKNFLENNILNYSKLRNYDFGTDNRDNVSCLSPYITHRMFSEYELIKNVLKKYKFSTIEKFVQEVFWRVYWKGWLEKKPKVWADFVNSLNTIKICDTYYDAIEGKTEISCFNEWVNELKTFNYLHNHTRMWFASIWIFTLKLHWQLGAKFFLEHLYDGDAASNTLSWRWVAGLQTKGKHYLAKSWNIEKFTNNRFKNVSLNEEAKPIIEIESGSTQINKIRHSLIQKNKNIIVFENDLLLQSSTVDYKKYDRVLVVLLDNEKRNIKLSNNVLEFKKSLINDFNTALDNSRIIKSNELEELFNTEKTFDVLYPSVGENLDYISKYKQKKDLNLNFIIRQEDKFCWQFANKGFFNFKKNIQNIINELQLS